MSLIGDALRKARQEASERESNRKGILFSAKINDSPTQSNLGLGLALREEPSSARDGTVERRQRGTILRTSVGVRPGFEQELGRVHVPAVGGAV